jgi:uncharacterized protein
VIFVDTGAWYASFVPKDEDYSAARAWLRGNKEPLLTTDYVVDELLTLLKANDEFKRALELGRSLLEQRLARLARVTDEDLTLAWKAFQKYADKEWSFTDCVSYAVIERLGIKKAFAFDRHFRQFGTVEVIP